MGIEALDEVKAHQATRKGIEKERRLGKVELRWGPVWSDRGARCRPSRRESVSYAPLLLCFCGGEEEATDLP